MATAEMASAQMTPAEKSAVQILEDAVVETRNLEKITKEDGTKLINSYEVIRGLGKGAFGKVKLCRDTRGDQAYFAMKIMDKTVLKKKRQGMSNMLQQVQKEIAIMKKLSHVNCIRMYEVIDDPTSNKLYLRLEFATGGQCMEARNGTAPLPIDVAQRFFTDMILGLEYLHHNHVLHRDIKPENLLVCSETGRLKLADFGVSQHLEGSSSDNDLITKSAGTAAFMAPECCVPGAFHGKLADIWAAGISLYFFLHGSCPFVCSNIMGLYDIICHQSVTYDDKLPHQVIALLNRLLAKDPAERMRIKDIKLDSWFLQDRAAAAADAGADAAVCVMVSESEIQEAFTVSMKVVLLVKVRAQMKKSLSRARDTIQSRSPSSCQVSATAPVTAARELPSSATILPPSSQAAPPPEALSRAHTSLHDSFPEPVPAAGGDADASAAYRGVVIPQGMAEYEDSDGEDVGGLPAAVKGMERVKEGYREKQVSCARLSLLDKTRSCAHQ